MDFIKELSAAVTVCDRNGIIVYMNNKSAEMFHKYGGQELLGKNLIDCHLEPSKTKIKMMLETQTENIYTTEKNGKKKYIFQTPIFENGEYNGFAEMIFDTPPDIPHYIRD